MAPVAAIDRDRWVLLATMVFVLSAIFLVADQAQACAVCFGGEDSDWTGAFVLGTLVMLVLPPAIVVGAVFAIYRAIKRQEAILAEAEQAGSEESSRPLSGLKGA